MYRTKNEIKCCDVAFLYERLSRDDELDGESNSIANQDGICQGYFLQYSTNLQKSQK